MISIADFTDGHEFMFGLNPAKTATALRKMADEIEACTMIADSVAITDHASSTEYTQTSVAIKLVRKVS